MVKFKSRYILLETLYDDDKNKKVDAGLMMKIIKQHIENLFGDIGLGKVSKNLQIKYVNNVTNLMIIRVGKEFVKLLWTALALMNDIDNDKVRMHIIAVSGTIKKCEIKAKNYLESWTLNFENLNKKNI